MAAKKRVNRSQSGKKPTAARPPAGASESSSESPPQTTDEVAETKSKPSGPPVAGIGASAGGLDAFKKFFTAMPADSGIAFVLIPHLDPRHESLMVELIRRHTSMPVAEAEEGAQV